MPKDRSSEQDETTTVEWIKQLADKQQREIDRLSRLVEEMEKRLLSCPCAYTVACKLECSCASTVASGGCERCLGYGSFDQRLDAASYLSDLWDETQDKADAKRAGLLRAAEIAEGSDCLDNVGGSTGNAWGTQKRIVGAIRAEAERGEHGKD